MNRPFSESLNGSRIPPNSQFIHNKRNNLSSVIVPNIAALELLKPLLRYSNHVDLSQLSSVRNLNIYLPKRELKLQSNLTLQLAGNQNSLREKVNINLYHKLSFDFDRNIDLQLVFSGSYSTSKFIEIVSNSLTSVNFSATDFERINIIGDLARLNKGDFSPNLRKLVLDNKIPVNHVDEEFYYLEELSITRSNSHSVVITHDQWSTTLSKYAPQLISLTIKSQNINLTTIPWEKMNKLESLEIHPNSHKFDITKLTHIFSLSNKRIIIRGNQIEKLCEHLPFQTLHNLTHLDLSNNSISSFSSIRCLNPGRFTTNFTLILSNNSISNVTMRDWRDNNLQYVHILDMQFNLLLTEFEFATDGMKLSEFNFWGCRNLSMPKNIEFQIQNMKVCNFTKTTLLPPDLDYDGDLCKSIMNHLKISDHDEALRMNVVNVVGPPFAGKTTISVSHIFIFFHTYNYFIFTVSNFNNIGDDIDVNNNNNNNIYQLLIIINIIDCRNELQ